MNRPGHGASEGNGCRNELPASRDGAATALTPLTGAPFAVGQGGGAQGEAEVRTDSRPKRSYRRRRGLLSLSGMLSACFLFTATSTLVIFTLFTSYAPDTYVFVKYAYDYKTERTLQLQSVLDNNVVFDALSVAGARLGFSSSVEYLLMLAALNAVLFLVKYGYLLRKGRLVDVVTVFAASFYALDLNLFRLNLALVIFYAGLASKSRIARLAVMVGSGLAHFIPACAHVLRRCYYIPLILLAIVPLSFFDQKTRLFIYLEQKDLTLYKSLLFIVPFLVCYFNRRYTQRITDPMMQLAEAFAVTGFMALFFNTVIVARFFELAFILTAVANVFRRFSFPPRLFLMLFALFAFAQRAYNGIHAGDNNFVDEFILNTDVISLLF